MSITKDGSRSVSRSSSLTVLGSSLTAAQLLGFNPRFAPGDASNQTAVAQVV